MANGIKIVKGCGGGCGTFHDRFLGLRDFCVQQFPFIAEDFDALTTYEILEKVICYLKKIGEYTEEMGKAFNELKDYVLDTMDKLPDILEEKLQEMYEDGTIADIIDELFLQMTEKCKKIVYVNCYGAKGDGVSDDTQAIKQAVSENPNAIFIFYGKYKISDTIICDGVTFELAGSEFYWGGATGKAFFEMRTTTGKARSIIKDGRLNGDNKCTGGIDINGYHCLITGTLLRDFTEYSINIGSDGTSRSSQHMIDNVTIQHGIDIATPTFTGGSDVNQASGLLINNTDNQFSNLNILNCKNAVRINASGNIFTNCHFTCGFTHKLDYIQDRSGVEINPPSTLNYFFNNFENCYFDNWKKAITVIPDFMRTVISLSNCQIYHSGAQFTGDKDNAYIISGGSCPFRLVNVTNSGSTRVDLYDPYMTCTKNLGYSQKSKILNNSSLFKTSTDIVPVNTDDIVGEYNALNDNNFHYVFYGPLSAGKCAKVGCVAVFSTDNILALSGAQFTISDRTYLNKKIEVNVTGANAFTPHEIWQFNNSDYGIGVYNARTITKDGITVQIYDIYVYSDRDIATSNLSIKVDTVESLRQHCYIYTGGYIGNLIDIPDGFIKL